MEIGKFSVLNISDFSKEEIESVLEEFSCPINLDVQTFLREKAFEFTKKRQSITYLVFSSENQKFVGYFTIAIKPISINSDIFSNTMKKKLLRVSELNEITGKFSLSAYLIAQLGKNFSNDANKFISGKELLEIAINQVKHIQNLAGGVVVFLEAENKEKLIDFYKNQNNFNIFSTRKSKSNGTIELIQLLKLL